MFIFKQHGNSQPSAFSLSPEKRVQTQHSFVSEPLPRAVCHRPSQKASSKHCPAGNTENHHHTWYNLWPVEMESLGFFPPIKSLSPTHEVFFSTFYFSTRSIKPYLDALHRGSKGHSLVVSTLPILLSPLLLHHPSALLQPTPAGSHQGLILQRLGDAVGMVATWLNAQKIVCYSPKI